jgi:hypothetical protein
MKYLGAIVFWLVIGTLFTLFGGDPDIADAIIRYINRQ